MKKKIVRFKGDCLFTEINIESGELVAKFRMAGKPDVLNPFQDLVGDVRTITVTIETEEENENSR